MATTKSPGTLPKTAKRPQPKGGSRKGRPNKTTAALKEMILMALDKAGGAEYLQRQADESPTAFMALLGKVLPMTVNADLNHSGGITVEIVKFGGKQ